MVINLVWIEDHTDESATKERARVLRDMGFEGAVNALTRDADLDVRERAKTACDVLSRLNGEIGLEGRRGEGQGRVGASGYTSPNQAVGVEGLRGLQGWRHDSRG